MTNGEGTITLKGEEHPITLPPFAEREDLVLAYNSEEKHPRRRSRALVAGLGLCCPSLGYGRKDYENAGFDCVIFGGRVYSALMEAGHTRAELFDAASQCLTVVCAALFPRENEVAERANFTEADEAEATAQP